MVFAGSALFEANISRDFTT